jgi:hypothetical protein
MYVEDVPIHLKLIAHEEGINMMCVSISPLGQIDQTGEAVGKLFY